MKKGDKRLVTHEFSLRTSLSIEKVLVGEVIEIQQVDVRYGNVLVDNVWVSKLDIEHYSIPHKETKND